MNVVATVIEKSQCRSPQACLRHLRYFKKKNGCKITHKQVAKVESIIHNRCGKCLVCKRPLYVASAFVALAP